MRSPSSAGSDPGIEGRRLLVHVREHRHGAGGLDSGNRGDARVGRGDDLVARLDAGRQESDRNGVGARRDAHAVRGAAVRGERRFERLEWQAEDEPRAVEHRADRALHVAASLGDLPP